jgi:hypothetical protein
MGFEMKMKIKMKGVQKWKVEGGRWKEARFIGSQGGSALFMVFSSGTGAGAVYRARLESVCW